MTRPRKQTVDWFPHSCTHGKTMFTLEREFGVTGYAFWFKLLEVLGNTEGHFMDAEDRRALKYLQAQTFMDTENCLKILDTLADLDAIDPKLWEQKIIWSQNFVNGLAALYRNRNKSLPVRPDNYRKITGSSGISTGNNPIRKEVERVEEVEEGKRLVGGKAPPTTPTVKFTVNDLAVLWNEIKPPELSSVNLPLKRPEKDMAKIKDVLKRNPEREWWERVILRLHQSPHCRGYNERGWKASFDFMVSRAEVILDGKYDGGKGGFRPINSEQPGIADWLREGQGEPTG